MHRVIIAIAAIVTLTPYQKGYMDGRCAQGCIDEHQGYSGYYNQKEKICECKSKLDPQYLNLSKDKIKIPLTTESEEY